MLTLDKEKFSSQDRINLEKLDNFDIIMSTIKDNRTQALLKQRAATLRLLTLLFPDYELSYSDTKIKLIKDNEEKFITKDNYFQLKTIIKSIFNLNGNGEETYNPQGKRAKELEEQFKKAREKIAQQKGKKDEKIDIINRYASILAIGLKLDINDVMNWTLYQLFDQYDRYLLKVNFDISIKAKLAGGSSDEEPENWMKSLHE